MLPDASYTLQSDAAPLAFMLLLFVCVLLVGLGIRFAAGSFDSDRVRAYVRSMGGRLLELSWEPFGPGWLGEKGSRIYRIVYADRAGRVHRAHAKTSMFSGVYLTEDVIIGEVGQQPAYRAPRPVAARGGIRHPQGASAPEGFARPVQSAQSARSAQRVRFEQLANPSDAEQPVKLTEPAAVSEYSESARLIAPTAPASPAAPATPAQSAAPAQPEKSAEPNGPLTYRQLQAENAALKARIRELESGFPRG